jgi:hypothetical protein
VSRGDSPLRDRVVFLVGARRSGTNWLQRMLAAHPDVVAMATETYLISHGVAGFAERFQHVNPEARAVGRSYLERDRFLDAMRDVVDLPLLATLEREHPGARYVVERTPWHAQHLALVAAVYPDAHVLDIVRDGRAVAQSLVAQDWGPGTVGEAAAEWRESVRAAAADGPALGPRYRRVRYEDLLADPRAGIAGILDWLELATTPEALDAIAAEGVAEFNVSTASPGVSADKWRTELSPADIGVVEDIAGDELVANGYPLENPARPRVRRPRIRRLRGRGRGEHAHHELVLEFERRVAAGDVQGAQELLAPGARVQGDADPWAALQHHVGADVLAWHVHRSPELLTGSMRYRLGDGSEWARLVVYRAQAEQLSEIVVYRYRIAS